MTSPKGLHCRRSGCAWLLSGYPFMNGLREFGIVFEEPLESDSAEEYDVDPLDELTAFELGMHQYAL